MEKILFDKAHSVAFTGHRFISMDKQNELKQSLQAAIIEHYKRGIHNCICGMALGFDMMVADMVLSLKSRLPYIHLLAFAFRTNHFKCTIAYGNDILLACLDADKV